jgi:hypothetical protein
MEMRSSVLELLHTDRHVETGAFLQLLVANASKKANEIVHSSQTL